MRCEHNSPCSSPKDLAPSARPAPGCGRINDRGVALIVTLLLLFLLSIIGLAAVLTSSSDLLINGYYRNYRGSFYAADSGLNIARQEIYNYFDNNGPASWTSYPPIDATTWGNSAATFITNTYGASYSLNSHGQAGGSWAESFKITSASVVSAGNPQGIGSPINGSSLPSQYSGYLYSYNYTLTSVGSAQGSETAQVFEKGTISVGVSQGAGTTANTVSFSAFGAFINSFTACQGPLVQGYLTGPMYAKGEWNWGSGSPGYIFTDPVSQTDSQFSYYPSGGGCVQSSSVPYGSIRPTFQSGYSLSVTPIALPRNDFSQRWAVLDGKGCGENNGNVCGDPTSPAPLSPTNAEMHAALKNISGTTYPTSGASTGVWLPYTSVSGVNTVTGGGILVEGNAQVVLTAQTGPSPNYNPQQVFTIKQGSSPTTTTTITIDQTANTTQVSSGSTTLNLAGVPQNLLTTPAQAATMLYVDGDITSLSGPSSGAAIQNNSMVTVAGNGDITATDDITYKTKPVTTSANQNVSGSSPACCSGTPADTLIPLYQNMNQVLGIFTATGNFILSPTHSGDDIEVDGSIAMISQDGVSDSSIGHIATGHSVGTFTNIGGRIENRAHSVDMDKSNVYFDRRFTARTNFAPPWFPSTIVTANIISSTITANTSPNPPSRTFWQYQAGQ
jgi:hypothetical protein